MLVVYIRIGHCAIPCHDSCHAWPKIGHGNGGFATRRNRGIIAAMPATLTPQTFVAKWRKTSQRERGGQGAFPRPLPLLDHPTPADVDADGRLHLRVRRGQAGRRSRLRRRLQTGSSAGSTRASTPTWKKPTSNSSSTASRSTTRRCWWSATSRPSSSTANFVNRANRPATITLDDLLTPAGMAALRAVFADPHPSNPRAGIGQRSGSRANSPASPQRRGDPRSPITRARSPTSTTRGPRGWITRIASSTRRSSPPTAGPPI